MRIVNAYYNVRIVETSSVLEVQWLNSETALVPVGTVQKVKEEMAVEEKQNEQYAAHI